MRIEVILGVVLGIVGFLVLVAGCSALGALVFWALWNWIMAGVFSLPALSFLQAWGLWFLLCMVLGITRRVRA